MNGGLGWDGVRFAKMVESGPAAVQAREINSYYVQRVGPSFAVRAMLEIVGADPEPSSIRLGFVVWNLTLLSVALLLLLDAANRMGLGPLSRWVLFLGLFVNPANGRLPIYYAPIGDSTAFFLGALTLWGYLARRPAAMVVSFLRAIVSWPAAFLLLPLLLWPRSEPGAAPTLPVAPLSLNVSRMVGALALPLGLGLLALLRRVVEMPGIENWASSTALALATNGLQLGCAAGFALALALVNWRHLRAWPSIPGLVAAAFLIGISFSYVRRYESGSLAFSGVTFFREVLLFARSQPFAALVGHAAYYSALAIAAAALWPKVLREGLKLGPGAFASVALSGLLALDAESRRLNAFWPLVAFVAVLAMERLWSPRAHLVFCATTLVLSKLWWPMTGP